LREWHKSADYCGKKNKGVGRPHKQAWHDKGALASAVEKEEVSKRLTISVTETPPPTTTTSFSDDEARAYIMSLMKATTPPATVVVLAMTASTASTALAKRVTLQSKAELYIGLIKEAVAHLASGTTALNTEPGLTT
jgi:hypothetical protein